MAIQALETELGAQLFIRNQRKVVLSEVGVALREHADNIPDRVDRCQEDIKAITAGAAGRLGIGFTAASSLLSPFPSLIHAFRTRYPEVLVTLQDLTTLAQIAALEKTRLTSA